MGQTKEVGVMLGAIPYHIGVTIGKQESVCNPTDEVLIARVSRRDSSALESLYARYGSLALGLAVRIVGDRHSGEEIVQEAFWRVWNRAHTYSPGRGRFRVWLFGIVRNLAIDELRQRNSRPPLSSADLFDWAYGDIADERSDVAATAISNVTGDQVREALAWLPSAQRQVVELAYFQGMTHKEISEELREPLGTIHTRARMALNRLRKDLTWLHASG
jgi:RNA polymerase sigma-70 factor (ECF subfamily)